MMVLLDIFKDEGDVCQSCMQEPSGKTVIQQAFLKALRR